MKKETKKSFVMMENQKWREQWSIQGMDYKKMPDFIRNLLTEAQQEARAEQAKEFGRDDRECAEFIRDAQKETLEEVLECLPEDRAFELREDNPQYSLGQANGWYLYRNEIQSKIKEKIKRLKNEEG